MLNYMKSLYLGKQIFILLGLFCSMSFGQGWNTTVQTSINEPNIEKMELFTNASGNHILIKRANGNIVYYNINSSGTVDANKTAILETAGDFPSIVGSGETVYALYKTGNVVRAKYSTNGGTSWVGNSNLDRTTTSNLCNGIDAVYEDGLSGGVHLVWATRDNNPNFETYYSRLNTSNQWVDFKNVTDHSGGWRGGKPSVTFSSNRIHISFNTETGTSPYFGTPADAQTRDKVGSHWEDPQLIVYQTEQSTAEKTITNESNLFLFYSEYNTNGSSQWRNLNYKTRGLNDQRWSEATELAIRIMEVNHAFNLCYTFNNDVHLLYDGSVGDDVGYLIYRFFSGLNWSYPIIMNYENTTRPECSRGFTNVSNDLFVIWTEFENSHLLYKHYDAAPLEPQNYTASIYVSGNYRYPRLNWSLNNEPDVRENTSAYKIERRTRNLGGTWSSWSVLANLPGYVSMFTDYTISTAGGGAQEAEYRLTAIDLGNKPSPTQSVTVTYGFGQMDKISSGGGVVEYGLDQNFPNPFNPTTSISYQIKDRGFVSLKIYDMLGKEVVELVNKTQESGIYSVSFDASNMPSGVYVYSFSANEFIQNRKMTLMK